MKHQQVYRPSHPKATASGCVWAHVDVAERALGRYLPSGTEVHHVDGNPRNNVSGNLVICQDKAYHKLLHVRTRVLKAGGDPNTQRICSSCGLLKTVDEFNRRTGNVGTGRQSHCRVCSRAYAKTYERHAISS